MAFGKPNVEKLKAKGDLAGLKRALRHKDWHVHTPAGTALAQLGVVGVQALFDTIREVEALGPGNVDEPARIARNAAHSALSFQVQGAAEVDLLLAALAARTDDDYTLMCVANGLGHAGDSRAVPPLVAILPEGGNLANSAASALGELGGDEAVAALRDCVRADGHARVAALDALETLGVGMGEALSDDERQAVEQTQTDSAVKKRLREWESAVMAEACTICHRKPVLAKRVPVYEDLLAQGFVSQQRPDSWQLAPPGASTRDYNGLQVFCDQCAADLARFAVELEAGRIAPAAPAAREVVGILALTATPVDNHALLQQIVDEHKEQGDRIADGVQAHAVTAGESIDDEFYAYGALRAAFPAIDDVLEQTRKFKFTAPDGSRGYYYLVFSMLQRVGGAPPRG